MVRPTNCASLLSCSPLIVVENCFAEGEIGFFDFYIIPLAKKLQESGVFGVYGDEYVKNAQANRDEWVECGKHAVAEMMNKVQAAKKDKRRNPTTKGRQSGFKKTGSKKSLF